MALVRTGLIGGIVVAAVVYPLAAVAGLGVKAGADQVDKQVEALPDSQPAQTTRVYAADGTTLVAQFYDEYRTYTPISQISGHVKQAIVAAEDSRFYEHHGVDMKGVVRAFVANHRSGEVSQGASTLTMQYVRNVLRDNAKTPEEVEAATEQTGARKIREIQLAVALEQKLNKVQILEKYLNVAYFGHRAYGISAAAEIYFSKSAADLTLPEAAMLAGLVQAPSTYDPAGDQTAAHDRRNYVIDRMVDLGYVTPADAGTAKTSTIALKVSDPPNDCVMTAQNDWGYFCDYLKSWWLDQPAFGSSPQERYDRLRRGGYRIITSLDVGLQESAHRNVLAKEPATSTFAHGVVAIEPGSGHVKTMAVNRVYSMDESANGKVKKQRASFPNTVNPLLGGGDLPGYQAGSTFKLFTMLAALEQGKPMTTSFYAPQQYRSIYITDPSGPAACGTHWCPQNASKSMTGTQTLWSGFGKSVNTYFVQLEQKVGSENAVQIAERLGLRWRTDVDKLLASPSHAGGWGSFTLGVADTTPLEMADAYATIAADGSYCQPLPVLSITDVSGKAARYKGTDVAAPRCQQAVRVESARAAVDAARCVTGYGSARGSCGGWSTAPEVYPLVKRPVAGKTGTTDNNQAAWFVGISPALAVASFIADPDNPRHPVGAANHWKPIRSAAEALRDGLANLPPRDFAAPTTDTAYGAGQTGPRKGTGSTKQRSHRR
jgi:membrane peptidoglycan carboxypeptidase